MMKKLKCLGFAILSWQALAQEPVVPRFHYRAGTGGNFSIYNDTAVFSGDRGAVDWTYTRYPLRLSPTGSGTAWRNSMSQTVRATLHGHADFGSISYSADLLARVGGEYFTGQNSTALHTGSCRAVGVLEMGYQDELSVVSSSLRVGETATLRMRVRYFGQRTQTTQWPEWVVIPPTGPGGQSTTVQEIRSKVDTEFRPPSEHAVRFSVRRPDGSQASFFNFERESSGERDFDFDVQVGGKVQLTHVLIPHGLEAETRAATASHPGDRESAHSVSGFGTVRVWSLTPGVSLESASGASYAPAAGQAILDARVVGNQMQLISPVGSVFQKGTFTPQGLTWADLPAKELLVLPMTEPSAVFRARLP